MDDLPALFADRSDAGRRLAARLAAEAPNRPVVYALPRGGVPVALEIARLLHAPLDLVLVRKIGAPYAPEWALGAVVDGDNPQTVINEAVRVLSGASDAFFARACRRELLEIARRRALYLGGRPHVDPTGRTAIVVDDGIATGATAKAALRAIRQQGAAKIILAVPVAPREALVDLHADADQILCLHAASHFPGVGAFYTDFHQLTDTETIGLLAEACDAVPVAPPAAD
jgi:putative phosphoribosyl transferase